MDAPWTGWRQTLVVALILTTVSVVSATSSLAASTTSPSTPLMVANVAGTSRLFVVSGFIEGCTYEPCLRLEETTDFGDHFTMLHLPALSYVAGNPLGNLRTLTFANAQDGYALLTQGSTTNLYVTLDGTRSWHRQQIATGLTTSQLVITHDRLYAVVAHCVAHHCEGYRVARSALNAKTWKFNSVPTTLAKSGFSLAAYDQNVWLNVQAPRVELLYVSHDGGRVWTREPARPLGSVSACGLTPESMTALWAQCPTGMLVSFFYSSNGGDHWSSVSRFEFSGTGGGAFDPVSPSRALLDYGNTAASEGRLYVVNEPGGRFVDVGKLVCVDISNLVFTNARHGVVICDQNYSPASTQLLRSLDGGATWSRVKLP
ncbi:MAG: hypothetical protein KGJ42_02315 [Acidobacteriota bacterium]|nr:hypothetical protein [Acidobacteriota bacterium]